MAKLKLFMFFLFILSTSTKVASKGTVCDSSMIVKHEYVDLGLPSGTLWATMNIGAKSLEDCGFYFSWGEVEKRGIYNWRDYKFGIGSDEDEESLVPTKYNDNPKYSVVDSLYTLSMEDDVAFSEWGPEWRMPRREDFLELLENCKWKWKKIKGVFGYKVKSKNGNWLFIPLSGLRYDDVLDYCDEAFYWTSSLYTKDSKAANILYFNSKIKNIMAHYRSSGCPIRPVRTKKVKD